MKNFIKHKLEYTTTDIARLGVKRERLKVWLGRMWIIPSIQIADGAGTKNLFSEWDLYMILLFKNLLEHGFVGDAAYGIIRNLSLCHNGPMPDLSGLPEEDRAEARKRNLALKEQTNKDFIAFFKRSEDDERPTALFFGFNSDDADDIERLGRFLSDYEAIVMINFKKIRDQVKSL